MRKVFKNKWIKRGIIALSSLFLIALLMATAITLYIQNYSNKYIYSSSIQAIPNCYTALVLGASVHRNGDLSTILLDRVDRAIELYNGGKIKRFLLSGDHGDHDYDEVNTMKNYLLKKGIDSADIFLDHAGFDTYNSVVRAKEIFNVDSMYIVTQNYHLYRAIYIARNNGIEAFGFTADRRSYPGIYKYTVREWFANVKSWYWTATNHQPHFLGNKIPMRGDSRLSWDK